jgi:hypothetical protein
MSDIYTTIFFLCLYFIPSINAYGRHHKNAGAITMLNLLLGWTLLGWIAALVWSATHVEPQPEFQKRISNLRS